jgi:hypothetical protein
MTTHIVFPGKKRIPSPPQTKSTKAVEKTWTPPSDGIYTTLAFDEREFINPKQYEEIEADFQKAPSFESMLKTDFNGKFEFDEGMFVEQKLYEVDDDSKVIEPTVSPFDCEYTGPIFNDHDVD